MQVLKDQISQIVKDEPNDDELAMWRAVFALAHADGHIAEQETGFIKTVMDCFKFSKAQQLRVTMEMAGRSNLVDAFKAIQSPDLRRQFFRLARCIVWSDGFLHEDEVTGIDALCEALGEEARNYENELRWIRHKPKLPLEQGAVSAHEEIFKFMMLQMLEYYKAQAEVRS